MIPFFQSNHPFSVFIYSFRQSFHMITTLTETKLFFTPENMGYLKRENIIHLPTISNLPIYRCFHSPTLVFREGHWVISLFRKTPSFGAQNPSNPDPRFGSARVCIAWDLPRHGEHCEKQSDTVDDAIDLCAISLCISCSAISGSELLLFFFLLDWREMRWCLLLFFFVGLKWRWDDDHFWWCLWWVGWLVGSFVGWLVAPMTYKEIKEVGCKNHFQRMLPLSNWRDPEL